MSTLLLIIRDIVQLSTLNNFIKHSLASPVLTISGATKHKSYKGKLQS